MIDAVRDPKTPPERHTEGRRFVGSGEEAQATSKSSRPLRHRTHLTFSVHEIPEAGGWVSGRL